MNKIGLEKCAMIKEMRGDVSQEKNNYNNLKYFITII